LLIETIFNISHNHNCTLCLAYLLHFALHTFSYPNLKFIVLSLWLSSVYAADNSEFNSNIDNPNSFYIKLHLTGISFVKIIQEYQE
ncbi:hypothetical protein OTUT144_0805, partial [Orientia tsutsugamushi str. UT144]